MSRNGSSKNGKLREPTRPNSGTIGNPCNTREKVRKFEVRRTEVTAHRWNPSVSNRHSSLRTTEPNCAEETRLRKKRVNVSSAPIYSASTSAAHGNRARSWSTSVRRMRSSEHEHSDGQSNPTSPGAQSFDRRPIFGTHEDPTVNSSGDHTSFLSGISMAKVLPVETGEF